MGKRTEIKSVARSAFLHEVPIIPGSVFFLFISSVIVIISAFNPGFLSNMRMAASDTFSPVLSLIRSPFDAASDVIGDATGLAALKADNVRLMDENDRLREWYQRALALQVENQTLHSLLNVKLAPELKFNTARVLSDTSSTYAKSIILASGADNGIDSGQAVLSGDGVLGRVVEVGDDSARVLLLTDLNSRIPVIIEGSNSHAIVAGTNERQPVLTHLPEDTKFKQGDRLLTSGLGGIYPPGLPVGVVSSLEGGDIRIMPYADINRIQYVRVITNAQHRNLQLYSAE